MCRRPAVSTRITSLAESLASLIAPRTISSGLSVPVPGQQSRRWPWPLARAVRAPLDGRRRSKPPAAGGRAAPATSPVFRWWWFCPSPAGRRSSTPKAGATQTAAWRACQAGSSQFVANDLDHLLIGRKLQHALRCPAPCRGYCVSSSSATPTFTSPSSSASRISASAAVQVLFVELALPAQVLEYALQLLCKVFKHGRNLFSRD